ncbi:MAG: P-loop NTPase [Spirochaetales bacterium]|nr:P-loop NTPase [Spirochaetales bacterium]
MHILPVASGKGGVGKSLLAANLAIALAEAGKDVVCADLDLGASNLHILLGIQPSGKGVGFYLKEKNSKFEDCILQTEYPHLRFIPGDSEIPGIANITQSQKKALISKLLSLKTDYLILDLGAGTHLNVLDFFLTSSRGILMTMPTLTSMLNAYLFLKNALFRILSSLITKSSPANRILDSLEKDGTKFQKLYLPKLLKQIKEADKKVYDSYMEKANSFAPRVIMNMLENEKDSRRIDKLRMSIKEYLGIEIEHLGIIYRDELQDIALNSRIPILLYKPNAVISQAIYRIADKLVQHVEDETQLLDFNFAESFQIAELEAQIDFSEKLHYIEDLMHSGSLSEGDLIDIIRSQHREINNLKKENQLLKTKLARAARAGFKV